MAVHLTDIARANSYQANQNVFDRIGVDEKLDARLPLDTVFNNAKGQPVTLGSLFASGKPVILSLNYSGCPMLCSLQLNGLVDGLQGL